MQTIDVGEFDLTRSELRKILFISLYMKHGIDINKLALMPGFEFINEEIRRTMGENFFEGATILDTCGRMITNWNEEIKLTRNEDLWVD